MRSWHFILIKFRKCTNGSMTIEAALTLPVFIAFFLAILSIMKISILYMAMQSAIHETVKLVSTHVYGMNEWIEQGELLIESYVPLDWPIQELSYPIVESLLNSYTIGEHSSLKHDNLQIIEILFPKFDDPDNLYFGIVAEYKIKLTIPFINPTLTIREKAIERVWIGEY